MPQYSENISAHNLNPSDLLVLAYGTFQQLGWTVEFATDTRLVGYSKKKWNAYYDHIIIDANNETLTITSKLPESASFDLFKRNKKNVARFLAAFEIIKASASEENKKEWEKNIETLKAETEVVLEKETKEAQEVDAVMNLSSGSKSITYSIIAINIIVFIAMIASGIHFFEPSTADLAKWGANYKPYTMNGEWWRLVTSIFLHFGIIHIAFNMYALFMVGIYLEPMLGKFRYAVAYLCTGVIASITSIWWHGEKVVSAGASGAIFGMYGVLLALLTTKLIPKGMRNSLLQSMGIFVVYNLLYGARSGTVDNAAHLGGLVSGFFFGYVYFLSLMAGSRVRPFVVSLVVLIATITGTMFYLKTGGDDNLLYAQNVDELIKIEQVAIAPLQNREATDSSLLVQVTTVSRPQWQKAKEIFNKTSHYKLSEKNSENRDLLKEYIDLRIKQTDLIIQLLNGNKSAEAELNEITLKINEKLTESKNE